MREIIQAIEGIDAKNFHAPFTQKVTYLFNKFVDNEFKKLADKTDEYIKSAKEMGDKFTITIEESLEYNTLKLNLEYLDELKLLAESSQLLKRLESMVKNSNLLI